MSKPVSVVIPCYNQAEFLKEAIESALGQMYKPLEVIVVDDGSTDSTAAVAAKYDVCLLSQANRGLSAARNTGLRASAGEYVLLLDADDRLCAGGLAAGARCLDAHPNSAFAVGRFQNISKDGTPQPPPRLRRPGGDPFAALLRGNWIEMHGTVLYRRSVFDAVGFFDTSLKACEDYEMYLRITRLFSIATHDGLVAEYRRHLSCMSSDRGLILSAALNVLQRQRGLARRNPALWHAYRSGQTNWRRDYGQRALGDLIVALNSYQLAKTVQSMKVLLRYYPRGLAIAGAQALGRRVGSSRTVGYGAPWATQPIKRIHRRR